MKLRIDAYAPADAQAASDIWNEVVEAGLAFPQEDFLSAESGDRFFREQSFTGVARDAENGDVLGLYILHPNNVGRCGHICNASYAVRGDLRGQGVGEALVRHCLQKGRELGFRILQFNAVVANNHSALRLYKKLGFTRIGTVPGGFRLKDGRFEDIVLFYHPL